MTAPELLPCPFCGKVAHLCDDVCHSTAFFVGCETLGCFGNAQWDETQEEAVSKWNTRAALSADPAPVGDAWQSIDNITPDAGHVLLLGSTRHDARTIFTGWIAQNGMIYGDAWGLDCKPTHWMPLPKPPAGENGND